MGVFESLTMPMRRRSRAGSELAKDEARSFLPQHEDREDGEVMKGWKGLWQSQQWVIIGFAAAFGLLMLYVLAVSCGFSNTYFLSAIS